MGEEISDRVEKIESFLSDQLSFRPTVNSRAGENYVWKSISKMETLLLGESNSMGIQTKVRIMWWANYFIGAAMGSLLTILLQKAFH